MTRYMYFYPNIIICIGTSKKKDRLLRLSREFESHRQPIVFRPAKNSILRAHNQYNHVFEKNMKTWIEKGIPSIKITYEVDMIRFRSTL